MARLGLQLYGGIGLRKRDTPCCDHPEARKGCGWAVDVDVAKVKISGITYVGVPSTYGQGFCRQQISGSATPVEYEITVPINWNATSRRSIWCCGGYSGVGVISGEKGLGSCTRTFTNVQNQPVAVTSWGLSGAKASVSLGCHGTILRMGMTWYGNIDNSNAPPECSTGGGKILLPMQGEVRIDGCGRSGSAAITNGKLGIVSTNPGNGPRLDFSGATLSVEF